MNIQGGIYIYQRRSRSQREQKDRLNLQIYCVKQHRLIGLFVPPIIMLIIRPEWSGQSKFLYVSRRNRPC